jgi:CubicO group peptidase (beta-lactamase class C family)
MPCVGRWRAVLVVAALCAGTACTSHRTLEPPPSEDRTSVAADARDWPALGRRIEEYLDRSYSLALRDRRALLVSVGGVPVVERYYGDSNAATTADVHSVTKSVVSTLVGVALGEGRLRSLDQSLGELLPEHRTAMSDPVAAVTLRQVLTMTAGLPPDELGPRLPATMAGSDWVTNILRHGRGSAPVGHFAYASVGSHLLSAILERATGESVLAYGRPRLFDPLGVDTRPAFQPQADAFGYLPARLWRQYESAGFAWPRDPRGVQLGFGGLKLTARDMTALGELYLNDGRWKRRQLVPATWVRDATRVQVPTGRGEVPGYGYQWWTCSAADHAGYAAIGYGGQLVEVVPDLRLVVAVSTTVKEDKPTVDVGAYLALVDDVIAPVVQGRR